MSNAKKSLLDSFFEQLLFYLAQSGVNVNREDRGLVSFESQLKTQRLTDCGFESFERLQYYFDILEFYRTNPKDIPRLSMLIFRCYKHGGFALQALFVALDFFQGDVLLLCRTIDCLKCRAGNTLIAAGGKIDPSLLNIERILIILTCYYGPVATTSLLYNEAIAERVATSILDESVNIQGRFQILYANNFVVAKQSYLYVQ